MTYIDKLKNRIKSLNENIKNKRLYLKTIIAEKKEVLDLKNQEKQLFSLKTLLSKLLFKKAVKEERQSTWELNKDDETTT